MTPAPPLEHGEAEQVTTAVTHPLGVTRPPLAVEDLPTPEEVFGVADLGWRETVRYALGPSFLALGAAIGSGEWLLGPLNVGQSGFAGIGWIITVSALLQVGLMMQGARYVMATGEVPIVGFARVPPGTWLWVPFSLGMVYFAFIWGGWAKVAAGSLFALVFERAPGPGDSGTVELLTVGLLAAVLLITANLRRISRGLELMNATLVVFVLAFLVVLDLVIVSRSLWWDGIRGLFTPAVPPDGADATHLGALAGFTGGSAGFAWAIVAHYRDKGYGMGHRVGYLAGLRAGPSELRPVGVTFPDDRVNTARWRRWDRLLSLDLWGIFFVGSLVGMLLPTLLVRHLALTSGTTPDAATVSTYAADQLGAAYGQGLASVTLLVGFVIMFSTQLFIFETLVRVVADASSAVPRLRTLIGGDIRRLYFSFMSILIVVIAVVLHFFQPVRLITISANMANFAAMVFPLAFVYLNRRLPRVARPSRWGVAALYANVVFFGFFFVNFVWNELTGTALLTF